MLFMFWFVNVRSCHDRLPAKFSERVLLVAPLAMLPPYTATKHHIATKHDTSHRAAARCHTRAWLMGVSFCHPRQMEDEHSQFFMF